MCGTDLGDQLASIGMATQHYNCIVTNVGIFAVQHFNDVTYGMAVSSDYFPDVSVTGDDAGGDFGQPLHLQSRRPRSPGVCAMNRADDARALASCQVTQ
ncbi:hypothetical protein A4X20_06245 [Mycolicibacterium iranicum]|uniref:Uncharacterized protein n=1 Tax=Mycolicibacterium iranicum TaxID=912594 RepID=A0A178LU54_MYCIR|nr:hypothetical protein A4X20_06245 [Mycolicibacterium iranicum]